MARAIKANIDRRRCFFICQFSFRPLISFAPSKVLSHSHRASARCQDERSDRNRFNGFLKFSERSRLKTVSPPPVHLHRAEARCEWNLRFDASFQVTVLLLASD